MTASTVSHQPTTFALCPFHNGAETLDGLMAEIGGNDARLLDACLDLRMAVTAHDSAWECLECATRVRQLLDDRHHLAFYRLRCWLRRLIVIQVRAQRQETWQTRPLPLDFVRMDELIHRSLASLAIDGEVPACAQIRFAFANDLLASSASISAA